MQNKTIGKVAALEGSPTTTGEFTFWTAPELKLSPFDIVKVAHLDGSATFGQVEEISHTTDAASYLTSFISNDFGNLETTLRTERVGLNYVHAKVLWNTEEIYSPVLNDACVSLATREEIEKALGFDKIANKVYCGVMRMYAKLGADALEIPVPLNRDFLVGPEGAHLNISGISGLAAKTSYAMFLLKALTEVSQDSNTAFIVLNVKGKDLLAIDEPTEDDTFEETRQEYAAMQLTGEPLNNVRYFYPAEKNDGVVSTFLPESKLKEQRERGIAKTFKFTFEKEHENINLLFSGVDDPNQTLVSICDWVSTKKETIKNWKKLIENAKLNSEAGATGAGKEITVQSWRRFSRLITTALNSSGAFNDTVNANKGECVLADEILEIKPNDIFVVDVARESEAMQAFTFGHIMREVRKLRNGEYKDTRSSGAVPTRIVIVVDEMNKYCSKDSPKNSPLLEQILDITERGRSLGIVLFGAEQFRSAIHERVTGNCATKAYGRTNSVELAKKDYASLNSVQKNILMRMTQGEYIIENPVLRAPVLVHFPKPAFKQYK